MRCVYGDNNDIDSLSDRRVSCKDLGEGDCEGFLYKRKQKQGILSSHWLKRWCVLKQYNLFFFKSKEVRVVFVYGNAVKFYPSTLKFQLLPKYLPIQPGTCILYAYLP